LKLKNVNETIVDTYLDFFISGPLLAIPLIIFKSFYVNFFSVIIDSELSISELLSSNNWYLCIGIIKNDF
jgi:hypothetical protein